MLLAKLRQIERAREFKRRTWSGFSSRKKMLGFGSRTKIWLRKKLLAHAHLKTQVPWLQERLHFVPKPRNLSLNIKTDRFSADARPTWLEHAASTKFHGDNKGYASSLSRR